MTKIGKKGVGPLKSHCKVYNIVPNMLEEVSTYFLPHHLTGTFEPSERRSHFSDFRFHEGMTAVRMALRSCITSSNFTLRELCDENQF